MDLPPKKKKIKTKPMQNPVLRRKKNSTSKRKVNFPVPGKKNIHSGFLLKTAIPLPNVCYRLMIREKPNKCFLFTENSNDLTKLDAIY